MRFACITVTTLATLAMAAPTHKRQSASNPDDVVNEAQAMGESAMKVPVQIAKRQAGGLPVPSLDLLSGIQAQLSQLLGGLGLPLPSLPGLSGGGGGGGGSSASAGGSSASAGGGHPAPGGTAGPAVHRRDEHDSSMQGMGKALDSVAAAFSMHDKDDKDDESKD